MPSATTAQGRIDSANDTKRERSRMVDLANTQRVAASVQGEKVQERQGKKRLIKAPFKRKPQLDPRLPYPPQ